MRLNVVEKNPTRSNRNSQDSNVVAREWKLLAFEQIAQRVKFGGPRLQSSDYKKDGPYAVVDQGKMLIAGYTDMAEAVYLKDLPVIIFGDHTKSIKYVDFPFAIGADGVVILSPKSGIDPNFLYFLLHSKLLKDLGYARHYSLIKKSNFLIPPLPEQKRIAGILKEHMAAVEKARAAAEAQLEAARALTAAYLREVFNSEEAKGWLSKKLGDICRFIGGMQPPKSVFKYDPEPGYVRLVQIQDFRRDDMPVFIPKSNARRCFETDDVMIGRYGPPVFQILRGLSGAYNVALMKCEPTDDITKGFLSIYCKNKNYIQQS